MSKTTLHVECTTATALCAPAAQPRERATRRMEGTLHMGDGDGLVPTARGGFR